MNPPTHRFSPCLLAFAFLATFAMTAQTFGQAANPTLFATDHIPSNPQFENFGTVTALGINPDGTLSVQSSAFTNDLPYELALSPNGRWLAVGHASALIDEDLIIYRVNADATLEMWAVETVRSSPFEILWRDNETLIVLETQDGSSGVATYRFFPDAPIIERLEQIDARGSGFFSAHMELHPNRRWLYVPDSPLFGTSSIRLFEVATDGTLSLVQTLVTVPYALDLKVTPNGRFLYMVTGAGDTSIVGFSINQFNGMITQQPFSPYPVNAGAPSAVDITDDGKVLIAFSGATETLTAYQISNDDGFLQDTFNTVNIGGNGIFEAIEIVGKTLYVTKNNSTDFDAAILTYDLDTDFGTFTPLGGPVAFGTRPYFMDAWIPLPIVLGDFNSDQLVNLLDIPFFVATLLGQPAELDHPQRADMNMDGNADGLDIDLFTQAVLFVPTLGGCCLDNFQCVEVTSADCTDFNGQYQGDNTTCADCPLPPPPELINVSVFGLPGPPFCNTEPFIVDVFIDGNNFLESTVVTLEFDDQPSVSGFNEVIFPPNFITLSFDLGGLQPGTFRVRVTNPDGQFVESTETWDVIDCP